ncbi:hypothetical protein WJX79_001356 [Trebouxia sp. C0005]
MGAYLSAPVTNKEFFEGSSPDVIYGGASMQGWRRTMEDAHIATIELGGAPGAAMFGVFDGHGGSEVAKFCQVYMADELAKSRNYSEGKLQESLVDVFHRMDLLLQDDRYLRAALSAPEVPGNQPGEGGTNNAGALDKVRQLLELHRARKEGERSRIMAAGGFLSNIGGVTRVNGNLNLSRAIGDLKYKTNSGLPANEQIITAEPDVKHVVLTGDDPFFLLACDGVWDVMTNQQACDFVSQRLQQNHDVKTISGYELLIESSGMTITPVILLRLL